MKFTTTEKIIMTQQNLVIFDHPLISHKIALLRSVETGAKQFRELVEEITTLMAFEALKDVPTKLVEITTPLERCTQKVVVENSVVIVPVLRAGLGMVNGIHTLLPTAKVGHIGMYRDHDTLEPREYYCKLPDGIEADLNERDVFVLDPMLATGGSLVAAIDLLKKRGVKKIKAMNIIAAPAGIEAVQKAHPDVQLYIAQPDRCLNDMGYILPGLGDAGDRIFGTK